MSIDNVTKHYLICALWSSTDDHDRPLDKHYLITDLSPEALKSIREDVEGFLELAKDKLKAANLSEEQTGHDFWLTRNGHGTGFWDRGLGKVGDKLSDIAKTFGSSDIYVGADGLLYVA